MSFSVHSYVVFKMAQNVSIFKQPYSNTLDFLAAKMKFEIHNAYNIMIMSQVMRKTTICMGENEGEDQPRGNREADQRLCF